MPGLRQAIRQQCETGMGGSAWRLPRMVNSSGSMPSLAVISTAGIWLEANAK